MSNDCNILLSPKPQQQHQGNSNQLIQVSTYMFRVFVDEKAENGITTITAHCTTQHNSYSLRHDIPASRQQGQLNNSGSGELHGRSRWMVSGYDK